LSEHTKKLLKLAIQTAVSVALIAFVLHKIDLSQVKQLLVRPEGLPWIFIALLLFNASKIASAFRLNVYQRHISVHLTEKQNLKLYYAGMFLNMFLPGGIGGDGYKILVLHRRDGTPVKKLLGITLADRVSGLLILLLLLCVLIPFLVLPWPVPHIDLLALAGAVGICIAFVLMHRWLLNMVGAKMLSVFGYGVAVQSLQVICVAFLLLYLQVPLENYPAYLAVFLVSSVAAVLPLSFGGLGAREVTFFYCMNLLHLDSTHGVVASSGFFLITLVSSLTGIAFLRNFSLASNINNKLG
jgi:uncharacterized membrane protein YbhN (UPF0104 family)